MRLRGFGDGTEGDTVPLAQGRLCDAETGISGWNFPYGTTGIVSLGNDEFLISCDRGNSRDGYGSNIRLFRFRETYPEGWRLL